MKRWQFLSRLLGAPARRRGNRFAPRLELLEAREVPAVDVIFNGNVPDFNEDTSFQFGTPAFFSIENPDDPSGVIPHTATLTAQNGVLDVVAVMGPSVSGSGTSTVTITGTRDEITQLFLGATGSITFVPTAFFSGDGRVTVSATDGTTSDSEFTFLKVQPVLSQPFPTIFFDSFGDQFATAAGFDNFEQVFVPPFGTLLDADGSELVGYFISLSGESEGALPPFTLLSNGGVYPTAGAPNSWFVGSTNSDAIRLVLDSFVLVPPQGFSGRVGVGVSATHDDIAFFFDESVGFDSASVLSGALFLRFFQGARVDVVPGLVPEGNVIDLAGRFALSDPDALFGDAHTFRLTALGGALTLDQSNPLLSDLEVTATTTEVVLTGNLQVIQAVLNTPGALAFTANDEFFSGVLPLEVGFVNRPGNPFDGGGSFPDEEGPPFEGEGPSPNGPGSGIPMGPFDPPFAPLSFAALVPMGFTPVAAPLDPFVADASGDAGTAVALSIGLPPVVDPDGSETATLFVTGVPAGALLSAGTNLGGGVWALDPAQLAGLAFLSGTGGTFTMTAVAFVRDFSPQLGLEDVAIRAASFTVTLDGDTFGDGTDTGDDIDFTEGGGAELDEGISEFIDNEDFDPDLAEELVAVTPASIGAFNLVEVPVSARDAANPTDPSANPNGSREQVLAPIYGDGEKHPLPPVFPLDGSVPVAGFSDSGGDSFALLERLYRGELGATPIAVEPPAAQIELAEAPPPHEPGAPAGAVAGVQPQGADLVAVPVDVDAGTDWRVWAAAGAAVIGSAAAYALYARTRSAREQSDRAVPPRARLKPLERTP